MYYFKLKLTACSVVRSTNLHASHRYHVFIKQPNTTLLVTQVQVYHHFFVYIRACSIVRSYIVHPFEVIMRNQGIDNSQNFRNISFGINTLCGFVYNFWNFLGGSSSKFPDKAFAELLRPFSKILGNMQCFGRLLGTSRTRSF